MEERKNNQYQIVRQAIDLSSGTIADLTGVREYCKIDEIQQEFVIFCGKGEYASWQEAWKSFAEVSELF